MTGSKTLLIRKLIRSPQSGAEDELVFEPGVNIIAGRANTGKTKWLNMLDYLMGDSGSPEDAFGQDLADKYDSISALVHINGEELWFQRRWKQYGVKSKVFINDEPATTDEFSEFLLNRLRIPVVHFPKGSPYSERRWPVLSWRTLLRHIYRQQRFWSDFADKQPESEQHACLMQFLGIAEHLFSERYGELVEIRKEIWKKQGAKDQFLSILDRISEEIIEEKEIQVALTADSIDLAISRLGSRVSEIQHKREATLTELRTATVRKTSPNSEAAGQAEFLQRGELWVRLQAEKEENLTLLGKVERRLEELQEYKAAISDELARMERVRTADRVLADIKVTHCPVCDQPIEQTNEDEGTCFLCHRPWNGGEGNSSDNRIDFEMERLRAELQEAIGLIDTLSTDREERLLLRRKINEEIERVDSQLRPVRQVAATILPAEIAVLDIECGRIQERIRQLERIKVLLELQREISEEIDDLQHQEELLKNEVGRIGQKINYERGGDILTAGMNTYLNVLKAEDTSLWTQPPVRAKLQERSFEVTVDNDKWSTKLGGTLILYFLLSYHYALLRLTKEAACHYPGLVILDLPATLEDGSTVADKENFVVEPFISLVNMPGMDTTQVIVVGSAFEGLEGVHRNELAKVWK